MREYKALAIALVALTGVSEASLGQTPDSSTLDRESLGPIPSVYVEVLGLESLSSGDAIDGGRLLEHAIGVLEEEDVPLMDEESWRNTIGQPALYIRFNIVRPSNYFYIYHMSLEVRQLAILVRDTTRYVHARTWTGGEVVGTVQAGNLGNLPAQLDPMLRRFAVDYHRAREEFLRRPMPGVGL